MKKLLIVVLFFTCKSYGQTVKKDTLFVSENINFIKIGSQVFRIEKSVKLTPVNDWPLTGNLIINDSTYQGLRFLTPNTFTPYYNNPSIRPL